MILYGSDKRLEISERPQPQGTAERSALCKYQPWHQGKGSSEQTPVLPERGQAVTLAWKGKAQRHAPVGRHASRSLFIALYLGAIHRRSLLQRLRKVGPTAASR